MKLPDGPIFVAPLPSNVTGVDFLGLAAVNERLVALAFPGISNVTRYMRVYSAMAWMAWRFAEYLRENTEGRKIAERDIAERFRRFREKVELLFTLGNPDYSQIAGQTRRNYIPNDRKRFPLEFTAFGEFKISWLDAAVYGPSLNVESGLGFLERAPGSSYRPSKVGRELALALDTVLIKSPFYAALRDGDLNTGTREMIEDLSKRWPVRKSTSDERSCFRKAFFPSDAGDEGTSLRANRVTMGNLILRSIKVNGGEADYETVRQTIARGVTPNGRVLDLTGCAKMQGLWAVLQLRQLQRLAHEALLRWVEVTLLDPPPALRGATPAALTDLATTLVAEYLHLDSGSALQVLCEQISARSGGKDYFIVGLSEEQIDPFHVRDRILELRDTQGDAARLPAAVVYALVLCAKHAAFLASSERHAPWLATGGRSRLSLRTLVDAVSTYSDQSLKAFVHFLIESCVIGQHFAVTGAKLEPDKNKYRFITTEQGLRLLIRPNQLTRLAITGDRLDNALELMADCGLVKWKENAFSTD